MTQEVLKMALEALKLSAVTVDSFGVQKKTNEAITAIKEALAQPEQFCDANCVWTDHHPDCKLAQPQQEPVAWMYQEYRDDDQFGWRDEILFTPPPNDPIYFRNITPVYTHPPQRTEQEPVKIVQYNCKCGRTMKFESVHGVVAPQRTWVGLTKKEVHDLYDADYVVFHQRIEAKLKEFNT